MNLELTFPAMPTLQELQRKIVEVFSSEGALRRPHGYPAVDFHIARLQIYDDVLLKWTDLVTCTQLHEYDQLYVFQPQSPWHIDVQKDLPAPRPPTHNLTATGAGRVNGTNPQIQLDPMMGATYAAHHGMPVPRAAQQGLTRAAADAQLHYGGASPAMMSAMAGNAAPPPTAAPPSFGTVAPSPALDRLAAQRQREEQLRAELQRQHDETLRLEREAAAEVDEEAARRAAQEEELLRRKEAEIERQRQALRDAEEEYRRQAEALRRR
jgi:hypothetical protein